MSSLQEYQLLLDISDTLNSSLDLKDNLDRALATLADTLGMIRGMITILNPAGTKIHVEVAHDLSPEAILRGHYKPGEGIIGRVIQTGRSMIVPMVSSERLFLNRTAARKMTPCSQELSFICVPIKNRDRIIGSLSVDRFYDKNYDLKKGQKLLSIIATLIACHVIRLETIYAEREKLRRENLRLQKKIVRKYDVDNFVGKSTAMVKIFEDIYKVARSNITVLIRGESGTGKELVSKAIHYESDRAKSPFVKVNCAALPTNLIESELFGHEKGSFTGAASLKTGKFEMANTGTIFLDEIGSLSLDAQGKLLRVLQEREFERVGGQGRLSRT